MLYSQSVNKS